MSKTITSGLVSTFGKDLFSYALETLKDEPSLSEITTTTPTNVSEFQEKCMAIATLWRNQCVNNEAFQNKLKDEGVLMYCVQILKLYFDNEEEWTEHSSRKFVLVLFQTVANAMTGNKAIQIYLFEISDGVFFKEIIPKGLQQGKNMTNVACMCIYNSIAKGNLAIEYVVLSTLF